jgi:hypothetical protein
VGNFCELDGKGMAVQPWEGPGAWDWDCIGDARQLAT